MLFAISILTMGHLILTWGRMLSRWCGARSASITETMEKRRCLSMGRMLKLDGARDESGMMKNAECYLTIFAAMGRQDEKMGIKEILPETEILALLAEEAAELAQAALKLRRVLDGTNPTPVTEGAARNDLVEEYGDVLNCADQLFPRLTWPCAPICVTRRNRDG